MRHSVRCVTGILAVFLSATVWPDDDGVSAPVQATHRAMGTEFILTLYAAGQESDAGAKRGDAASTLALHGFARDAFEEIDRIEDLITTWRPESQVSYLNRRAADGPVRVSPEVVRLLEASRRYFDETGGAFDCTVGPLSRLYGLYDERGRLPADEEIAGVLPRIGMDLVWIDRDTREISFKRAGVEVDFGGIGKGFAVDRVVELLRARGVTRALVDGGTSSVFALGAPPGEDGWTVRVRHPYNSEAAVAEIVLRDESLSTSGCYDLRVVDGVAICNIFDPRTGLPRRGMLSATVIAPSAMQTDALSTAFLVMGVEEARKFCVDHPDVQAIMVPETPNGDPAVVWIGERFSPAKDGSTR